MPLRNCLSFPLDTMPVSTPLIQLMSVNYNLLSSSICSLREFQVYSNGLSEVILGKAIKEHKLPRDEIVVMTKVTAVPLLWILNSIANMHQVFFTVGKEYSTDIFGKPNHDALGYVNQHGLSRKVIHACTQSIYDLIMPFSIFSNPSSIVWNVFSLIMLMYCNVNNSTNLSE